MFSNLLLWLCSCLLALQISFANAATPICSGTIASTASDLANYLPAQIHCSGFYPLAPVTVNSVAPTKTNVIVTTTATTTSSTSTRTLTASSVTVSVTVTVTTTTTSTTAGNTPYKRQASTTTTSQATTTSDISLLAQQLEFAALLLRPLNVVASVCSCLETPITVTSTSTPTTTVTSTSTSTALVVVSVSITVTPTLTRTATSTSTVTVYTTPTVAPKCTAESDCSTNCDCEARADNSQSICTYYGTDCSVTCKTDSDCAPGFACTGGSWTQICGHPTCVSFTSCTSSYSPNKRRGLLAWSGLQGTWVGRMEVGAVKRKLKMDVDGGADVEVVVR